MTRERAVRDYADKEKWNRMSLMNISAAGYFAADRSIHEYAKNIWGLQSLACPNKK
jgi:starch phosphorylase